MADPSTTVSAVRRLQLSSLSPTALQQELMGTDVDIDSFAILLSSVLRTNLVNRIADATITRSIETASSLVVTVNDYERDLLTSGLLSSGVDVEIDGLWFRLAGVDKQGDQLTLTFEDREVSVLREYSSWKIANRQNVTRAQFILNLIREVKEFYIPVVIPELQTVQAIERFSGDLIGVDMVYNKWTGLNTKHNAQLAAAAHVPNIGTALKDLFKGTPQVFSSPIQAPASKPKTSKIAGTWYVKGVPATQAQLTNANQIIQVGQSMSMPVKVQVCAVMTAIQESDLNNYLSVTPGSTSVGLFQQQDNWGSYTDRTNPQTAAKLFYEAAIKVYNEDPGQPYWQVCYNTQHCAAYAMKYYAQWYHEASILVANAGSINGSAASNNNSGTQASTSNGGAYYFYRGTIEGTTSSSIRIPETSWDCILRLAQEVNWRAFFVSGVFYYISENELYMQAPQFTITEWTEGVLGIDGQYDRNKLYGQVTLTARVGRWLAPPGSVVFLQNMGPWDGRWLVHEYTRDLFDLTATITLGKPLPQLPEPITSDASEVSKWVTASGSATASNAADVPGVSTPGQYKYPVQKIIVDYCKKQLGLPYVYGTEDPGVSFDCSGLAQAAYKAACVDIPRTTFEMWGQSTNKVPHPKDLMPGDLVFFAGSDGTDTNPGHVGIFTGFDGTNYNMINAPYTGVDVRYDTFNIPGAGVGYYVGATRDWWPVHGN